MTRFQKILNWIFALTAVTILFVAWAVRDNTTGGIREDVIDLSEGWLVLASDGTRSEAQIPYAFTDGRNSVQLVRTLPDVLNSDILLVDCNYHAITASIDGREIYHSGPSSLGPVETDLGHYVAMIPMQASFSGKQIVLTVQERSSGYNSDIDYIHLTTLGQYGFGMLQEKALSFVLAVMMIVLGGLSLAVWVVFFRRKGFVPVEVYQPLFWVSIFSGSVGLWVAAETHLWAIATGAFTASGILSYLSLSIMPVSLMGILKSICKEKLRSLCWILSGAKILLIAEWLLFLTGIMDISRILMMLQLECVFALVIFVTYLILNQESFRLGKIIHFGFAVALVLVVLTFGSYLRGGDWMPWAMGALQTILAGVIINTVLNINQVLKEAAKTHKYKEYAMTDIMTGLKSRYAYTIFEARFKLGALSENLCLVYMDIDGLKKVNDTIGHAAGDEMIIETSRCIREAFEDVAECFRMGGDEFLVAMTGDSNVIWERVRLFERLLSQRKGNYVDAFRVSFGVAIAGEHPGIRYDDLLKIVDQRMYENKKQCETSK